MCWLVFVRWLHACWRCPGELGAARVVGFLCVALVLLRFVGCGLRGSVSLRCWFPGVVWFLGGSCVALLLAGPGELGASLLGVIFGGSVA